MSTQETETYCPKSRADWRKWLEKNHDSEQSIWLVHFKSSTKVASLTWSEAVDEALCFGWIDSTRRPIDEERYMQYFSKRKPKSMWSRINKEKVDQLIQNNLMTQAGLACIDTAKENGSWTFLDKIEALVIPEDLAAALAKYKGAKDYFDGLSKSAKKILLRWVIFTKRIETRQKKILEIEERASENLSPIQFK